MFKLKAHLHQDVSIRRRPSFSVIKVYSLKFSFFKLLFKECRLLENTHITCKRKIQK